MKSTSFLSIKLHNLLSLFTDLSLRYEFKEGQLAHLIEVTPEELLEDNNFIDSRISLRDEFENLFPNEDLIFTSKNSLIKIKHPQDIFPDKKLHIGFKNNALVTEPNFTFTLNSDFAGENNFALAA